MNNKQDKIIQIEKLIERNNSFGEDFLSRNEIVIEIEKIINNKEEKIMRELNSASTGEISKAMSKAFMKIDNAKKSTQAYSYKYADLGSIIEGTKEILGEHGLHVKHQMDFEILENGEMVHVMITEIRHDSDEFFRSYFPN